LDLVIANAGVGGESHGKRIDWAVVSRMINVNVSGAAATITGALPGMVKRGKGQVVGISSLAAFNGMPRMGVYCGTKAFLGTFLEGLRLDLKPLGISVCSIHPGFVKSEMTAGKPNMPFLLETDDAVERMAKAIERRDEVFLFPWQLAMAVKTLSSLPRPLFEVAARKLR
jgi:short-subunit dehydrogenase